MKNEWFYATLIIILSIAVVGFGWIAMKKPRCEYKFTDQGGTYCLTKVNN